jgi:S-adenosylmethionine synthetase
MTERSFLFTSESVTEGHPDKVCDQISDAILDSILAEDQNGRVACETFVTIGLVIVGGEITTTTYVDINKLVRSVIEEIGYTDPSFGFHHKTCSILNAIGSQSADIAQGVNLGGAGDQGLMTGYACSETKELMPLPIMLAHRLCRRMAEVRKQKILGYLGPDGKSQVTVEYVEGQPRRVKTVVLSTQHTPQILDYTGNSITEQARQEIKHALVDPVIPEEYVDDDMKVLINPTGKFVIGGPQSDTGMTGRKIIVDSYGGMATHGGGAFSGKDPTKVDRSAAYAARYIAKNVVASGIARKCQIQLAYAIGVQEPVSIALWTDNTSKYANDKIIEVIDKRFDLTPRGIIDSLDLLKPRYRATAAYGHFGREEAEFTWENTDLAKELAKEI